jgi:small conductance mechanosensitive channel
VEVADHFGRTESIQVFHTVLVTRDNKTVTIPNSEVTGSPIVNYSKKGIIRLDLVYGIGYEDDLLRAKEVLREIVTAHEKVLAEPAPTIGVLELGDSSVNFAVRPYVRPDDYWATALDLTEQVKLRFDEEGISIPFPQRDVHLFQES